MSALDPNNNPVKLRLDGSGNLKVSAEAPLPISSPARTCVGRQTLAVTTGAVATLTPPVGAVAALLQADGNAVSVTLEGTNPTATVGFRVDDGAFLYVDTPLASVKMISRSGTVNVQVSYFDKV